MHAKRARQSSARPSRRLQGPHRLAAPHPGAAARRRPAAACRGAAGAPPQAHAQLSSPMPSRRAMHQLARVLGLAEVSAASSPSADRALLTCSTAVLGPLPCPAASAQAPSSGGASDARVRRALATLRPGGPVPPNIVTRRARLGGWRAAAPIVVGSESRALCAAGSGLGSASWLALAPWSGVASPLWPGALASPLPSLLLLP